MPKLKTHTLPKLVLTCEHAGNRVPRNYAKLFAANKAVLDSHEGWDPGALQIARLIAKRLKLPLLETRWTRLLVEPNRSPTNRRIWSRFTSDLAQDEHEFILDHYWRPHREKVEAAIESAVARGGKVVHVAVHSFTPVLDGEVRNADVAFLFDSKRAREGAFARQWAAALAEQVPELRVRYNYPYRGCTDGLPTWLRHRNSEWRYLGFELEVNQNLTAGPHWRRVGEALAASLAAALPRAYATPKRRKSVRGA